MCSGNMTSSDWGIKCICPDGSLDCFSGDNFDCQGICDGPSKSDDVGGCCLSGEIKSLYPDLDETSNSDGDCERYC